MRDIETAVSSKQGRVWAGHQPTLSGVLSQGSDLEPPYLLTSARASCYPLTPDSLWGPGPRDLEAGPKVLYLSRLAQPQVQEALQVPVTPPLRDGCGVGGSGGTCRETNKTSGGEGRWQDTNLSQATYGSATHRPTLQPRSSPSPEPQPRPGRTSPLAHLLSCPDASRPFCCPRSAFSPQTSPNSGPGRWASRWRRHASWCAAPAPWSPARSSISRATARPRCPWSSCWTSVSGEVGPGKVWGAASAFSPGVGRTR